MERRIFNILSDEYYSFRENLNKSNDNKMSCYECYLIDENWFNEFEYILKENKKNESSLMSIIAFPKNIPQILDTFPKAISILENNKNIYFINTCVIELMYSNNNNINLKDKNTVQIYPRYNNVIIEFKKNENNDEIKSLLLVNALTKEQTNIFIINVKMFEKINIFKKILNDFKINDEINQNSIDKNCIIPLKEYSNAIINEKNIIKAHIKEDLLIFFIYIFYYEKSYKDNKYNYKKVLSDFQNYYLINYEWLNQLKKYYNYDELYNLLRKKNEGSKEGFIFSNLRPKISELLKTYLNEDNFCLKPLEIPQHLMNIDKIVPPKTWEKDTQIYQNCFIVNSEIMKVINNYIIFNKKINFQTKKLSVNFRELFLFDENNVIMYGSLNEQIFVIKYVIIFKSSEIFNSEKKLLLSLNSFNKYLIKRKDEINSLNKQQLFNEEKQIIGQLIKIGNGEDQKNKIKENVYNKTHFNFYKANEGKSAREIKNNNSNSNEASNLRAKDNKDILLNKKNIEKPSEKNESKTEEKNLIKNDKSENDIDDLEILNEKNNESISLINPIREIKIEKNQLNIENKEFKIQKDELSEKSHMGNQKKEERSKILNKEYLNIERNSKGTNFKKKNIQAKKNNLKIYIKKNINNKIKIKRTHSDPITMKKILHELEKTNIDNKINNVLTNTINSNKVCKLKHKENKEKLGKKEEEYIILKMNKSNKLNSLIEKYQTKFKKCKTNILKIEELIEIISSKLKEIDYIGKFCMSFNELKQKIEETKALLNKDETNENNECVKYDKNLIEIPGIKLEEIENKNKKINKAEEDELKNMINILEKEKTEKDNKIELLEKNIDEINNNYKAKLEEKDKELKEIKLLNERIKKKYRKIRAGNIILQKEKENLIINYKYKENKNNIYFAEKLKYIKNKENLIKKEIGEINLIKHQLQKCFEDIKEMQNAK